MNLSRVLDVSLPELPRTQFRESFFRFNPETIWREHKEPKHTSIMALVPKTRKAFVFTPEQWELIQLFDGRRNYEQIAALWRQQCGSVASPEAIRGFAENLDLGDFWHKTPQEESAALAFDAAQKRRSQLKQKNDFSKTYLWHFDADQTLTRAHKYISWLWSTPFVIASLAGLLLMLGIWIARWDEVWRDSLLYWNMTEKSLFDVLAFYLLFAGIGFFHECGHAFTAKHFGAEVHRTGLMLVYTTPAFFVDTVEVWVFAPRLHRIYTVLAGFWFELMICAVATLVWWGTPGGSTAHDFAYKIILVGGIMPVIFNMNPLMKMDGYLCFCELIRIQNLNEKATAYLSSLIRKYVFRMPAAVPHLPRRRAIFFATFAALSGFYSYAMLMFLSRLTYRIFYHFSPEWAFIPATLVAARIFKTRIEKFVHFCGELYVSKKVIVKNHWRRFAPAGFLALLLLFVPLWREEVDAPFVLEPSQRAVLRAQVPGLVQNVFVKEGESIPAGASVADLRDLNTETEMARAASSFGEANARATNQLLRYVKDDAAPSDRRQWLRQVRLVSERQQNLRLISPIAGTVVTPDVEDLRGTWVASGATIVEVQDLRIMRARIFIPDPEMHVLTRVTGNRLHLFSSVTPLSGVLQSISPTPQQVDPGLLPANKYAGMQPPPQYVATIDLDNTDGSLRAGMSGDAKVFGVRRSTAGVAWRTIADFVGRKLW